jgi:transposase
MAVPTTFVGIDVSKAHLDVACLPTPATFRVANDAAGWADLVARLAPASCIVLEATGAYHRGVTAALAAAGMPAAVVNPERTHAFITSEGQRTKTDRTDARLLARFAQQKQPHPSPVPTESARHLKDLVACRDDLTKLLVMEKNRLTVATDQTRSYHAAVVTTLTTQRAALDRAIAAGIAADPALAARDQVLQSMPGLGPVLSAVLLATLPELGSGDAKGLAALAGVAPHTRQSGTLREHGVIRGGRVTVRKALYQMAVTATRRPGPLRAHYLGLVDRGKPRKVALIAAAHWMLGILHAMLRDGVVWPDTRVAQGRFLPQAT